MKKLLFTLSFGLLFLCFSCMETTELEAPAVDPGSQKDPVTEAVLIKETNSLVANPDIKVLSSENTTFQSSLDEIKSGTVKVISESYDKFNVGDVLAIAHGGTVVFQKVEEAEGRNGEFVMKTSPAVLTDIIMDGTIETRINLVEAARQKMIETKAPEDFVKPYLFYIGDDFSLDIDNFLNFKPGMHWGIYMGMKLDFRLFKPLVITTYTELDFGYKITGSMKEGDHKVYEKDLAPLIPSFILNYVESLEVSHTLDLVGIENIGDLSMDLVISVKDIHVPLMIENMALANVEFEFSYDANLQVGTKTTIGKTIEVEQFMEKEIKEPVHYFKSDLIGYLNMEVGLTAATDIEVKEVRITNPSIYLQIADDLLDVTKKLTTDYTGLAEVMFVTKNSGRLAPELSFASSGALETKFVMDIPSIVLFTIPIIGTEIDIKNILGDKQTVLDEDNILWETGTVEAPENRIIVAPDGRAVLIDDSDPKNGGSDYFGANVELDFTYDLKLPWGHENGDPITIEYDVYTEKDERLISVKKENIEPTNVVDEKSFTLAFDSEWATSKYELKKNNFVYTPHRITKFKNIKLTFSDGTIVQLSGAEVKLEVEVLEVPTVLATSGKLDIEWGNILTKRPADCGITDEKFYEGLPITLDFSYQYGDGLSFPSGAISVYFSTYDSKEGKYADRERELNFTEVEDKSTGFNITTSNIPWRAFSRIDLGFVINAKRVHRLPYPSIRVADIVIVHENGMVIPAEGSFNIEIEDYVEALAEFNSYSVNLKTTPEDGRYFALTPPQYKFDIELTFDCGEKLPKDGTFTLKYGSTGALKFNDLSPEFNEDGSQFTLKVNEVGWDAVANKTGCKGIGKLSMCDFQFIKPEESHTIKNVILVHNTVGEIEIGDIELVYQSE